MNWKRPSINHNQMLWEVEGRKNNPTKISILEDDRKIDFSALERGKLSHRDEPVYWMLMLFFHLISLIISKNIKLKQNYVVPYRDGSNEKFSNLLIYLNNFLLKHMRKSYHKILNIEKKQNLCQCVQVKKEPAIKIWPDSVQCLYQNVISPRCPQTKL